MTPTSEQIDTVNAFKTGESIKVKAYAGAGKTSTLVKMAESSPNRRGLYMAFNKAIAAEAQLKFPFQIRASTAHSLAFQAMRHGFDNDKMFNNPRVRDANLGVVPGFKQSDSNELVARTLRRFMQSADLELTVNHVPDLKRYIGTHSTKADVARWRQEFANRADTMWKRMIIRSDRLPLGHDGYLKLWAMGNPYIAADLIFVDEAQDLNPVLLGVLDQQFCQIVSVGDGHQQIYDWRGAVNALDRLEGKAWRLSQSFRFGDEIAEDANVILRKLGETVPLRGNGKWCISQIGTSAGAIRNGADAILCRSNGGVIRNALAAFDQGRAVYVPGGVAELRSWVIDAAAILNGRAPGPGELMGMKTWAEVQEFSGTVDGSHLAVFVKLVDEYGSDQLGKALDQIHEQPQAGGVTISTTHKAKGLEWDDVHIDDDFTPNAAAIKDQELHASQFRLLYVAMTRAKVTLTMPDGMLSLYAGLKVKE